MGGRRQLLIFTVVVAVASVVTMAALLFLPTKMAFLLGGVSVILLLSFTSGATRHRRDAMSKAQAAAAQRGDQAAFMGSQGHGSGW